MYHQALEIVPFVLVISFMIYVILFVRKRERGTLRPPVAMLNIGAQGASTRATIHVSHDFARALVVMRNMGDDGSCLETRLDSIAADKLGVALMTKAELLRMERRMEISG